MIAVMTVVFASSWEIVWSHVFIYCLKFIKQIFVATGCLFMSLFLKYSIVVVMIISSVLFDIVCNLETYYNFSVLSN